MQYCYDFILVGTDVFKDGHEYILKANDVGDPWVAQWFSAAYSPGRDPEDPGSSSTSGSLHGACFSLCLCLCHSLSLSLSLCVCVSHE